jgi:hypothetical protein
MGNYFLILLYIAPLTASCHPITSTYQPLTYSSIGLKNHAKGINSIPFFINHFRYGATIGLDSKPFAAPQVTSILWSGIHPYGSSFEIAQNILDEKPANLKGIFHHLK